MKTVYNTEQRLGDSYPTLLEVHLAKM